MRRPAHFHRVAPGLAICLVLIMAAPVIAAKRIWIADCWDLSVKTELIVEKYGKKAATELGKMDMVNADPDYWNMSIGNGYDSSLQFLAGEWGAQCEACKPGEDVTYDVSSKRLEQFLKRRIVDFFAAKGQSASIDSMDISLVAMGHNLVTRNGLSPLKSKFKGEILVSLNDEPSESLHFTLRMTTIFKDRAMFMRAGWIDYKWMYSCRTEGYVTKTIREGRIEFTQNDDGTLVGNGTLTETGAASGPNLCNVSVKGTYKVKLSGKATCDSFVVTLDAKGNCITKMGPPCSTSFQTNPTFSQHYNFLPIDGYVAWGDTIDISPECFVSWRLTLNPQGK